MDDDDRLLDRLNLDAVWQAVVDGAAAAVFVKDRQGRYRLVNRHLEQLTGRSRAQIVGCRDEALFPAETAAQLQEHDRQVWALGRPLCVEESAVVGGGRRHYRSEKFLLRDAHGQPYALCGISVDITDLRIAQAAMGEKGRLLQLAFDAVLTWRLDGVIERWNGGAQRLYGYTEAEALGRTPHDLLAPVFPEPWQDIEARLRAGGDWTGEIEHRCRDGRTVVVAARLQHYHGLDGCDRVLEINRDITEQRRARNAVLARERELQATQIRLDTALSAGGMGVWELVPSTDQSLWYGPIYERLGLSLPDEPSPRDEHFRRFMHADDRPVVEAAIARALLDRSDFGLDYRVLPPEGSVRWLASRGRFVPGDGERPDRFIGVTFDITERKAVEQALRETDTRRNEFLAMLAHELRNPLAPIHNAVRLLEHGAERPELLPMATQMIKRQAAHLARLVDDLLEVSRVTQGRIELRKENLLVATAVLSAAETVRPLVREQRQTMTLDVPTDIDLVADPARVIQIVANLLNNASKYTPEGGDIQVEVRTVNDGRWVRIEVRDNGIGLDEALLPRVFDLFTQGEHTLDRSRGGLGIGLSLVKSLVELHGGTVHAASAGHGQGSTFHVCLPREDRRATPRSANTGASDLAEPARLAPTSILIADDNRDAAESFGMLLEADGHRVRLAFDGEQALAEARSFAPRIVLLDLGMPRRDGFEVARALRADAALREVVLIALSGYGQRSDREKTTAAGFDAHLLKPADLAQVYGQVQAALARRAAASAA